MRQFVKSSDHEDYIDRQPLRSEAALLLWQDILPFEVIAQAIGDYLEKNLVGMCHERDVTKVTATRPILLCSTMIVASFYSCGGPPPRHTAITMACNCCSIRRLP